MKDRTLRQFRLDEGYTQAQMARICKCSLSQIQRMEKKKAIAIYNKNTGKFAVYLRGLLEYTADIKENYTEIGTFNKEK